LAALAAVFLGAALAFFRAFLGAWPIFGWMTGCSSMTATFSLVVWLGIPLIISVAFSENPDIYEDDAITLLCSPEVPISILVFGLTNGGLRAGFPQAKPIAIKGNYEVSVSMTCDPQFHVQSKHIDLKHHWIQNLINHNILNILNFCDVEQTANVLKKALPKPEHMQHTGECLAYGHNPVAFLVRIFPMCSS
jgi:hypothetical protein